MILQDTGSKSNTTGGQCEHLILLLIEHEVYCPPLVSG